MRATLIAMLVVVSAGLVGTSASSAAPANGAAIREAASVGAIASDVRYRKRKYGRACYTKCYYEFIIGPRVCRTFC
jgi:hypothetical protein